MASPTRIARIAWLVAAFFLAAAGCGLGVVGVAAPGDENTTNNTQDGAPPVADASATDAAIIVADGGGGGGGDGGGDASLILDDAGCKTLVIDDFTNPDSRWVLEGDARFDGGSAVLVKPELQHHGAIFIPLTAALPGAPPPTAFEASFSMKMTTTGSPPGDGIMIAWASDTMQPPLGGTGGQMGFCPDSNSNYIGPNGAAVAFHVSAPIGVSHRESDGGTGDCIAPQTPSGFTFGASHKITVTVTGTEVKARIDGTPFVFQLGKAVPIRWIGFTSATGGAVAIFSVDDVSIKVCF